MAVLADDVLRLLVIGQQLVYQCLVDRHRFPFSSSDGRLHSSFYTLKSSCAASCFTSCPAALSASAFSASWLIGGAPLSYLSVSAYSPTSLCRTHPQQPLLVHRPSPLVSAVQNVSLPWSSSNDFLYSLLSYLRSGALSLTLPNRPIKPLSTARASAPTAVVSLLTLLHLNPRLTFVNYPHRIASSDLPTLSPTSSTSPLNPTLRPTNRESPMQNP